MGFILTRWIWGKNEPMAVLELNDLFFMKQICTYCPVIQMVSVSMTLYLSGW